MNWGNKLILVFVAFALLIGTLVYKATHTKFELVSKDYYKDELKYQEKIDGINNSNQLSEIEVAQNDSTVVLTFPKEITNGNISGEALFYSITAAEKDRTIPIVVNNNKQQVIAKNRLLKANYKVKLTWKANNKNYYSEKDITVL